MSYENRPEFQAGLKKLKHNFREHLMDLMSNDGDGMVEVINDDASAQVPPELPQDVHMDWMEEMVGCLEVWVEQQLQTEVSDGAKREG